MTNTCSVEDMTVIYSSNPQEEKTLNCQVHSLVRAKYDLASVQYATFLHIHRVFSLCEIPLQATTPVYLRLKRQMMVYQNILECHVAFGLGDKRKQRVNKLSTMICMAVCRVPEVVVPASERYCVDADPLWWPVTHGSHTWTIVGCRRFWSWATRQCSMASPFHNAVVQQAIRGAGN